ncbi:MAG: hypothetical protein CO108_16620 [Deltaproteobacteria bacterium CG_4_9_14_3_um_filter_63_12]|nr:MAG: hypothetical protein CO108_16620 [Deltaproteobacteria bacterium CG_4_9_14_3_um_filter_63_12]
MSEQRLAEILDLSQRLIRNHAVSTGAEEVDTVGIQASYDDLVRLLERAGLNLYTFTDGSIYPALYCDAGPVGSPPRGAFLFAGHFDVVGAQSEAQFEPRIEGDWLHGRGSADMLTVVATSVLFMRDLAKAFEGRREDAPRLGLLLVSNEESGECEPWGTPFILANLKRRFEYQPECIVAGERTGEGAVRVGKVETKSRGMLRAQLVASAAGTAAHTALNTHKTPIAKIFALEHVVNQVIGPQDGFWRSTYHVSYINGGASHSFNITPEECFAGIEIRPANPGEAERYRDALIEAAEREGVDVVIPNCEHAVVTPNDDPWVARLVTALATATGEQPSTLIGPGKLPGSQVRFAPMGCAALVWGQSGVGPHSAHEAHYIPSILPFYDALTALARDL